MEEDFLAGAFFAGEEERFAEEDDFLAVVAPADHTLAVEVNRPVGDLGCHG